MRLTITLAAAAALLVGGASPAALAEPAKPPTKYDKNQCFYTRMVTSFAAPDDKTLYVRVSINDVYRFDLFGHCPDIDWNQRVALVSRASDWICDGMDAEVISHATGIGPQRCPVSHMHKLTPQEAAALPKRARP
jgi:hypothetical protein